jgi:hypothetical protein
MLILSFFSLPQDLSQSPAHPVGQDRIETCVFDLKSLEISQD